MICESHDPSAANSNQQTVGGGQACHPNVHHKTGGPQRDARVEKEIEGRWGAVVLGLSCGKMGGNGSRISRLHVRESLFRAFARSVGGKPKTVDGTPSMNSIGVPCRFCPRSPRKTVYAIASAPHHCKCARSSAARTRQTPKTMPSLDTPRIPSLSMAVLCGSTVVHACNVRKLASTPNMLSSILTRPPCGQPCDPSGESHKGCTSTGLR